MEFFQPGSHPPPGVGFPHLAATHVADYRFGGPQFVVESGWHAGGEWEDEFEENGGAVLYGNLEVSCGGAGGVMMCK